MSAKLLATAPGLIRRMVPAALSRLDDVVKSAAAQRAAKGGGLEASSN
jgi:hypothetical protein